VQNESKLWWEWSSLIIVSRLSEVLSQIDTLDEAIERAGTEIAARMQPLSQDKQDEVCSKKQPSTPPSGASTDLFEPAPQKPALTWALAIVLLCSIPGISQRAAEGFLAEIGLDMMRFASAGHLASWAGMCPGNQQSAGKRLRGRCRKGSPWLRKLLVEAAHAAAHTKHTYLSAQYHRLAARLGKKKAMMAVGHTILVIIYHVLCDQEGYHELGGHYFEERDRQAIEKRLVRRLEKLGYEVSLKSAPPAA
jgi:transposase